MPDRVEQLFRRCREENRAAFIPYICAGDPTLAATVDIALELERAGVSPPAAKAGAVPELI